MSANDPEPWNLLHDGVVIGVERDGDRATVSVRCGYVRARLPGAEGHFRLRLAGVRELAFLPYSDRWDEPALVDPAAIVAAKPDIADAAPERDGTLAVWGGLGSLRVDADSVAVELENGEPIALEALRAAVQAYWKDWRERFQPEGVHPLVQEAIVGRWSRVRLDPLLAAWREKRTSDLADVIEILDLATRAEAPAHLGALEAFDRWILSWDEAPAAALAELARCANATFDILLAAGDHEAIAREAGQWWSAIARCAAALRAAPPDPRIGRGIVRVLRSPSDHWFRVDQVAHVAGPFEADSDEPSFADHLFHLLEVHADAGLAERLEERAETISIECDCNGAEMAEELRRIAASLRERFRRDVVLPDAAATALRHRPVDLDA